MKSYCRPVGCCWQALLSWTYIDIIQEWICAVYCRPIYDNMRLTRTLRHQLPIVIDYIAVGVSKNLGTDMWVHHHVHVNGLVNSFTVYYLLSFLGMWDRGERGSSGSCCGIYGCSSAAVPRVPGRDNTTALAVYHLDRGGAVYLADHKETSCVPGH